jgi:hypothetical protein
MKRAALLTLLLLVAAAGAANYPDHVARYAAAAVRAAVQAWAGVEANPAPVCLAVGTFLLTVIYHKARGKSLRESVEVAATRVTVVPAPPAGAEPETAVIKRAKARATRAQLLTDQIGLQNRQRKLPEAITTAEKDVCYAKQALTDAERTRADRRKTYEEAQAKLAAMRKEKAAAEAELADIEAELKKMAALV